MRDVAGLGAPRALALLAPAVLVIGVFLIFPALWTLYIGSTDYELAGPNSVQPNNVGTGNVTKALRDPGFHNALWLTVLYVAGSAVIGQNLLGFLLAWALPRAAKPVRTATQGLVLLAWILPSTVVAFLWYALLEQKSGTLNTVLGNHATAWLIDYPMLALIVFNTWRGTAFSMMLYSSALATVPPAQLEMARLCGARGLRLLKDVVFPHIRGHVLTNTLLITLWTANDFTPYLLTAGGPNHASEVLPVFIYDQALIGDQLGYAAAVSAILLAVNLVIAVLYLRLLRRRT
ncbi:sugar ABC transporter permease [Nocardia sp. CDC159]|uniref:Sugar ABC transporter permease n=1 Tax=Nocardia pulmonis TaxID=2951408 RepID=A0A9X2E6B1_9NOCA|nr:MULTISPECIES: sugar ABC transporter permease [Nocardia]MCM6774589.1 sugar ABC transporter permease [Nocardia pulmonis]MCM6787346.1 sugar ABC transporter permease [Nocardia sp. CDC159]